MEPYLYRPLTSSPQSKPIRLLKLSPSLTTNAPLHCVLEEQESVHQTAYEALSYCWGSSVGDRLIDCEGKTLLITPNCEAALRRLRARTRVRVLWVDSICINQASKEEKSVQVGFMDEIYRAAARVLVWLGDDRRTGLPIQLAGSAMAKVKGKIFCATFLLWCWPRKEDLRSHTFYRRFCGWLFTPLWFALRSSQSLKGLILRAEDSNWLNRVWTLQEIVLAKQAMVISGSQEIPWQKFFDILTKLQYPNTEPVWHESLHSRQFLLTQELEDWELKKREQKWKGTGAPWLGKGRNQRYMNPQHGIGLNITRLLLESNNGASDPRDHVYGYMAVLQSYGFKLSPDYTKSSSEVFEDMTAAFIERMKSLQPLYGLSLGSHTTHSLPSWVYDWASKPHKNVSLLSHFIRLIFQTATQRPLASCGTVPLSPCHERPGQLSLSVRFIGTVANASIQVPVELSTAATDDFLKRCAALTASMTNSDGQQQKLSLLSYAESFAELFFGMLPLFRETDAVDWELVATWREWMEAEGSDEAFFNRRIANTSRHYACDSLTIREWLPVIPNLSYLSGATLFISDTGYVGAATASVREGDQIVLAAGSNYPLLVRAKGDFFELVSPCLVGGIMGGEAWHDRNEPDQPVFVINFQDHEHLRNLQRERYPDDLEKIVLI